MRFRLSSVFLSFLILGLCLAWAMDHISAGRINLVGTWRYPNDAAVVLGYWSRLTFHRDGKFEKEQKHRTCSVTYSGTYTLNHDGELVFHVTARSFQTWLRKEPQTKALDDWYHCRCAVDRSGYSLINEARNIIGLWSWPMRWYLSRLPSIAPVAARSASVGSVWADGDHAASIHR